MPKIHSMTAFARESASTPQGVLTVELRSVNHRYLDCSFKMPDALRSLEPRLREAIGSALSRGKLDCMIRLQHQADSGAEPELDEARLGEVLAVAQRVADRLGDASPPDPLRILQFPGVYSAPQASEEELKRTAGDLFSEALKSLRESRLREGGKLAQLVRDRLDQVDEQVAAARVILPELMQGQRDRILARLEELGTELDQGRLEQELVYLAQKADVDEELDRLETHVGEVRRTLDKGGPCGRRLDFLMQELNREANTLSSKSQSATTTLNAVELKVLIEQMREQIQNIE